MGIEQAVTRPPRCTLMNISSGESMECLFNPAKLIERVQVNWSRLAVPGLSHQVLQYQSTGNRQLGSVEFYLDRLYAAAQPGDPDIMTFRAFMRALTVPQAEVVNAPGSAPPRVLLAWPGVLTVESVITDLQLEYRRFGVDGKVLVYTASCGFEEILDLRVTSEQLRAEV